MYDTAHEHLSRVFREGFSAEDIAEPLVSFSARSDVDEVRPVMESLGYDVAGVRQVGAVTGYARLDDLKTGLFGEHLLLFDPDDVISPATPLKNIIRMLSKRDRLFVTAFGKVAGIITRSDLQKPPVRMWLFGMITIIEMGVTRLIEERFPGDEWRDYISPARLEKAEELLAERRRRSQDLRLLDCLQIADKGQILVRDEHLRTIIEFPSRREGERRIRDMEQLRNNLAHSQDIITADWETIVRMAGNLDGIIELLTHSQVGLPLAVPDKGE